MEKIVLIGSNIEHSRSPRLHNHLFERYGLPFRFELMPLAESDVMAALDVMKRGGYRGANVTSPHKFAVMPAIDAIAPEAGRIGAINVIVIADGNAVGHNTDVRGVTRTLDDDPLLAAPFRAAVIGTGGAARSAVAALLRTATLINVTMYSREVTRAVASAASWSDPRVHGRTLDQFEAADLVIHATPVGLAADGRLPIAPDRLDGASLLFEMIYWPLITPLMRAAEERGIRAVGGATMFVQQALGAFELWTGIAPRMEDVPGDLFA